MRLSPCFGWSRVAFFLGTRYVGTRMKVLVVEDDKKVGAFLQRALSEEGFVVDRAKNSAEALAQARSLPYDLLILDWMLPDGDGLSVCRELRASGVSAPILM